MSARAPLGIALALSAVLMVDLLAVAVQHDDQAGAPVAQQAVIAPIVVPAAPSKAAPREGAVREGAVRAASRAYGPVAMPECPSLPPGVTDPKTDTPAVPDSQVPPPVPAPPPSADLNALRGLSVWVTPFSAGGLEVPDIVARARQAGLNAIWVRTGGSNQGYYGDALLGRLIPAAHAAGIKIIAWDFPFLSDPMADVERARRALAFRVNGQGIDAFSPDIETAAEGTYATPQRLASYLSRVRVLAGDRAVVSTVPRPTDRNLARYPYAMQARWIDAYAPMIYWSCREPGTIAVRAIKRLSRYRPVHVVGQGYDMGDDGGRVGLPRGRETLRFLDASRRAGAIGGSLWTAETFGPGQWVPLSVYPWPPAD